MNIFDAILLGIIQGLTEFLPISSTAHLTLAGKLLHLIDLDHPEEWTAFIAVTQLGTMAAVVSYFSTDLRRMGRAVISDVFQGTREGGPRLWSHDSRMALFVVIGTLPVGLIGFSMKHMIEGVLTKSIPVIVGSLIVFALLLWLAEKAARHVRPLEQTSTLDAIIIGVAQALALIPGASRSGTTITAGLFLGLTREAAARFSFLLSIPAVFASGIYELWKIRTIVFQPGLANLVVATLVSAVAGYAAIAWLLSYLNRHSTMVFVWYRLALGGVIGSLLLAGLVSP